VHATLVSEQRKGQTGESLPGMRNARIDIRLTVPVD
jgi:hypothetical protein